MNKHYDVYLCRESRPRSDRAARNALWAKLGDDYNKQRDELIRQVVLSGGHLDFNKKIIGEA